MSFGPTSKYDPGSTSHMPSPVPATPPHAPMTPFPPKTGDLRRFRSRESCDCELTDYRRRYATSGRSAVGRGRPHTPHIPEGTSSGPYQGRAHHAPPRGGLRRTVPRHAWPLVTCRTVLGGLPRANPRASARCAVALSSAPEGALDSASAGRVTRADQRQRLARRQEADEAVAECRALAARLAPAEAGAELPLRRDGCRAIRSRRTASCRAHPPRRAKGTLASDFRVAPASETHHLRLRGAVSSRLRSASAASQPMNVLAVGSEEPRARPFGPRRTPSQLVNVLAVGSEEPRARPFGPRRSPSYAGGALPRVPEGPLDRALARARRQHRTEYLPGHPPEGIAEPLPPPDRVDPAHLSDPKGEEAIGDRGSLARRLTPEGA
jgi:hypothetical protein